MNNRAFNDSKKRHLYATYELQRVAYKSLSADMSLPPHLRVRALELLARLPRNSTPVRIHNRCMLTGRAHAVLRFCKLSRIKFRDLASQGLLLGIKKASW